MRVVTIGSFLGMCLNSTTFAQPRELSPVLSKPRYYEELPTLTMEFVWSQARLMQRGMDRLLYYHVPFQNGTFSLLMES